MARVIRFHYPLSYWPASKPRHAQRTRGKLIMFPPVAYRGSRSSQYRTIPPSDRRAPGKGDWVS